MTSDSVARMVRKMAETGAGTDACLEQGALPVLVHYYSPIPDIKDLERRQIWQRRSSLPGIDFRPDFQIAEILRLGRAYGSECQWPMHATSDPQQFFTHNGFFSYGCAAALHTQIRDLKPKRVIEVGSGNSSLVISAALQLNGKERPSTNAIYTIIDPYPRDVIKDGLPSLTKLKTKRIEEVDAEFFDQLEANDILFIDSSHVVKAGSDVNSLILDVLPRLKPGVVIHFHDIPMPYEYPMTYFKNPRARHFWNESYLLQAFLACNNQFEVLLCMSFLQAEHMKEFCQAFEKFDLANNWALSGSFWLHRKLT